MLRVGELFLSLCFCGKRGEKIMFSLLKEWRGFAEFFIVVPVVRQTHMNL